ncbi:hypothetical protein GBAR_LOCUS30148, partial [Geodia barretti]
MVTCAILLHQSLSHPNFAVPLNKGVNDFAFFCRHKNGRRDKPTILNTLTTVGVWNGNIRYRAAPIPILA